MTNPTPHWQVPEALIDLIDAYAETRHRCGGIYNAKTEAARKAVIEALSGVQALSAAPEAFLKSVIALCSHRVYSPANIEAWDKDDKWIADLWRQAESMLAASPTPPAEQQAPKAAPVEPAAIKMVGYGGCTGINDYLMSDGTIKTMRPHEVVWREAPQQEAQQSLTPETGNSVSAKGAAITSESGTPSAEQAAPKAAPGEPFQHRVQPWLLQCFGAEIAADTVERNHRFLEEALELVQSTGCTQSEAHQLVDYVFGRPVGEPAQEVGGVMCTLAALCLANGLDMHNAGEIELARIWTKVEAIRAKQAAKPKHSPLPQAAPQQEAQEPTEVPYQKLTNEIDLIMSDPDTELSIGAKRALLWMRTWVSVPLYTAPQPAPAELEQLRERISKIGLDVDRAMRGQVNEQSPLGTQRLAAIAALAKPAPAPLSRERVKEIMRENGYDGASAQHRADFINGIRRAEVAHGISAALAAQGGK